jgi:hypothetical protein
MILKRIKSLLLLFSLFLFSACYGSWNFFYKGNNVDERTKTLSYLTDREARFAASGISGLSGNYTVLILTDLHFGNTKKPVETAKLFSWLNALKNSSNYPVFALSLGDVVDLGSQSQYDEYLAFCNKLQNEYGIKLILNCCGNHDIYQGNWGNWEKNCYPHVSFYKFQTKSLSWYCLDTASGTLGSQQFNRLVADFRQDSRKKIIFNHYPLTRFNYDCSNFAETTERNKLISEYSRNNVICVLDGHNHDQTFDDLGFKNYGIPSFAYSNAWGLLHVDENTGSVELEYIE